MNHENDWKYQQGQHKDLGMVQRQRGQTDAHGRNDQETSIALLFT